MPDLGLTCTLAGQKRPFDSTSMDSPLSIIGYRLSMDQSIIDTCSIPGTFTLGFVTAVDQVVVLIQVPGLASVGPAGTCHSHHPVRCVGTNTRTDSNLPGATISMMSGENDPLHQFPYAPGLPYDDEVQILAVLALSC